MKLSPTRLALPLKALLICFGVGFAGFAIAGGQQQEVLAASVQASMQKAISDAASPEPIFASEDEKLRWLTEMSPRLVKRLPDTRDRIEFLKTVYYEAQRAGLDPQLVLGLIEVESAFRKYAVSSVGARGFMQVMPFWVKQIGTSEQNLFHLRTNLRYGCTILRHYLDIEKGDLYRALGRYNGSLGRPEYPNIVRAAWEKKWAYSKPQAQVTQAPLATVAQR
ncbi:MAG TPA: transglycosylase SLT domain-containing protein [Rhodocyclaceae bacterium]|nr:transglycosylase SLT domain-containing protein [Rhodocyclaceae bacterium]